MAITSQDIDLLVELVDNERDDHGAGRRARRPPTTSSSLGECDQPADDLESPAAMLVAAGSQ